MMEGEDSFRKREEGRRQTEARREIGRIQGRRL